MQEIEVPARDVFQHYVHVDQADKTLVWWFSTKRKNISFGLFFRKPSSAPAQLKSNSLAPSITPPASSSQSGRAESIHSSRHQNSSGSSGTTTGNNSSQQYFKDSTLSTSPVKSSHISNYASSRASVDSLSDEEDGGLAEGLGTNQQNPSQSSLPSSSQPPSSQPPSSQPSSRRKKTVAKFKDPDLIEILPIQHYDSGSGTIRGEYTVKEPGSYVVVFGRLFLIECFF
jgi:hypothetical protein